MRQSVWTICLVVAMVFFVTEGSCGGEPGVAPTASILYVAPTGSDQNPGTETAPFRTISHAAQLAQPGDTVFVKEGIYRERVAPARGGTEDAPITYKGEPGKDVFIKGSDIWTPEWRQLSGHEKIFYAKLEDHLFTEDYYWDDANPFKVPMVATPYDRDGYPEQLYEPDRHPTAPSDLIFNLGQVFVDGRPLRQYPYIEEIFPEPNRWHYDRNSGYLYVHFPGQDPQEYTVEITTRRSVFAPHKGGLGHIHVRGFIIEHAANQYPRDFWMRTEAGQQGALDTRYGHHWVIENNIIRYASGIGIIAGVMSMDPQTNSRIATGSSERSNEGGIIIRGNYIVDNGAGGILASRANRLLVADNVIMRNNSFEFIGRKRFESAGVKAHILIDSHITRNYIAQNLASGVWLDNRFEGSRISHNVLYYNDSLQRQGSDAANWRGTFLEMSNNSWDEVIIDNNIYLYNGVYGHDASGSTILHNLFYNVQGQHPAIRYQFNTRQQSRADHHTVQNNLFIDLDRIINIPYPAHFGGPVRSDYNVYDARLKRMMAVNRGMAPWPTRPNDEVFVRDYIHPDLGDHSPGIAVLEANDQYMTLDEWKAFWQHHQVAVDGNSLVAQDNSVAYDSLTQVLTVGTTLDLANFATAAHSGLDVDFLGNPILQDGTALPGPFQDLVQGQNHFQIWDGLPLLEPYQFPNSMSLTIEHTPIARDQRLVTIVDRDAPLPLLAYSEHSHSLKVQIIAGPEHGQLSGSGLSLVYHPEPGFSGSDALTYQVHDGVHSSDPATIVIQVDEARGKHVNRFDEPFGDPAWQQWVFNQMSRLNLSTQAQYSGRASIEITRFGRAMRTYNLLGQEDMVLSFKWRVTQPETFEQALVRVNDGLWHTVYTIDRFMLRDDEWQYAEICLAEMSMTDDFRLVLEGFTDDSDYTILFDEISIQERIVEEQTAVTMTMLIDGQGEVMLTPEAATYLSGDPITVTAQPAPGWVFRSWSGLSHSTQPVIEVEAAEGVIEAEFVRIGENVVSNPGFEEGLDPWNISEAATGTRLQQVQYQVASGDYAAKISQRTEVWNRLRQNRSGDQFEPGQSYFISFWARHGDGRALARFRFSGENTGVEGMIDDQQWVRISGVYRVPDTFSGGVILDVRVDSTDDFYIDEVIMAPLLPPKEGRELQ